MAGVGGDSSLVDSALNSQSLMLTPMTGIMNCSPPTRERQANILSPLSLLIWSQVTAELFAGLLVNSTV